MAKSYYRRSSVATINTKGRVRFWLIASIVVFVIGGLLTYPKPYDASVAWINEKTGWSVPSYWNIPFRLGLDLQGGTQLIYTADTDKAVGLTPQEAIAGVRDVIERRVNAIGVAEPLVQTTKVDDDYRVIVELAGVHDVNQAIKLIGETPLLEFKEPNNEPPRELTAAEQEELDNFNALAKNRSANILKGVLADPNTFGDAVKDHSNDPQSIRQQGGSLGVIDEEHELYDAAARLRVDQIARQTVETEDGFSILRLDAIEQKEEVQASHLLLCFDGAQRCDVENPLSKEAALARIQEIREQATTRNFETLVKENSTEPGADQSGGDLGSFERGVMVPAFEEAVFAMRSGTISEPVETDFGYHLIYKKGATTTPLYSVSRIFFEKRTAANYVDQEPFKNTQLGGSHLERAQVQFQGQTNEPVVSLQFDAEGAELFKDITQRNLNQVVAIYLDGQIISAPRVQSVITNGEAVIQGGFTIEDAKILAQRLNAGALPVPVELISQQTVGATLGQESVAKSMVAGLIGIALVALFMIAYYRVPGLLAVVALGFYAIILLALFKVIGVTLTLAGLAGVTLSLGMAVDANVLIFERLKEELRTGKPYQSAVDEAFKRAWNSIRDGNVSTLITTLILGWMSTSFIKGFAVTLSIGVILSMFTAIVVTRVLMKVCVRKAWVTKAPFLFLQQVEKGDKQ